MTPRLRVYGQSTSGNCHKVKLALTQLNRPFDWVEMDVTTGATQTPEYRAKNPAGQVPLLEIGPGDYLSESNAILAYLAEDSPLWPASRRDRAEALRWMFFEQYEHEPSIAVARFIHAFLKAASAQAERLAALTKRGHAALGVMELRLSTQDFLVGSGYSIADIALHAYTHVADEGGFDLGPYPAIRAWLDRIAAQPGYIAMPRVG